MIVDNIIQERKGVIRALKAVTYEGGEFKDPDGNAVTPTGTQGSAAGFRYEIDLSATTAADPGQGKLRFNNGTLASVTKIYIDNLTTNGSDISAFIDTWANSVLTIKANDNLDASFATFTITAVTNSTGYRTLDVTFTAGNSFSASEPVVAYIAPKGSTGATGAAGANGSNGARGRRAGVPYVFSTTTTASDPGSGKIRFNNSTIGSVTAIYVDNLTSDGTDISAFLALWTSGDTLIIGSDVDADTSLAVFTVTSTVNSTGYYTVSVTYVSGTTLSDTEACVIQRYAKGAIGDTGATGDKGGIPYVFSTTTDAADPGGGFFRLNNADPSLATALYVDNVAAGSMDVSAWLAAWQSGGQLTILSNTAGDNSFAIYTVGTVTNSTGYYTVAITYVAGSGFANNEPVVFQYGGGGGGTVSAVSNVNVGGVGVYKQTSGGTIEMRGVNAGSSKVTVTLDSTNNEIDIDVAEANLATGGRVMPLTGKFALTFSTGTADTDPTTGKFKFNSATIGSITKLWIDYLDNGSRNLANEIGSMVSGDKLLIYDATGVTLHTIATLSSTATDKTGYWEFTVTCTGGTGALPANNVACVVVYQSKTLLAALLKVDNFARFQSNGAGGYSLIDNTGSAVESAVNVYALSGKTISGVSTIPAASSVPIGTEALLHPDNLVGTGRNLAGIKVISDGTNWRPSGVQTLFSEVFGTIASPTITRTTTGRFTITDPVIPGGLLYATSRIRIYMSFVTTNAAATTGVGSQIWIGTDLTTYTNNSKAMATSTSGTANALTVNNWPIVLFTTTTTGMTSRTSGVGGAGGTGGWQDLIAGANTASDMMVTFEIPSMGSATSVQLTQIMITWEY